MNIPDYKVFFIESSKHILNSNIKHLKQGSPIFLEIGPHVNIENYRRDILNGNYINNTLLYGINI